MNTKITGLSTCRSRELTIVLCALCGKEFKRAAHHHKFAVKNGTKEFCSRECRKQYRTTSIEAQCSNCFKPVLAQRSRISNGSGRVFCNHKCSASFNNKHREPRSQESKDKTSRSVLSYFKVNFPSLGESKKIGKIRRRIDKKKCLLCNSEFRPCKDSHVCCSIQCDRIYRFGAIDCGKDDVIGMIMGIFASSGRTPMKREVKSRMYRAAVKFFGSWNKAIESCGLKANGNSPRNIRLKCSDGHIVRSVSEKVIDEWLYKNNLRHEVNKEYQVGKFTCDFHLTDKDVWIEYFGLSGAFKDYDETIQFKIDMTNERGMKLIALFPHHLYPENKLDEVLKDYL